MEPHLQGPNGAAQEPTPMPHPKPRASTLSRAGFVVALVSLTVLTLPFILLTSADLVGDYDTSMGLGLYGILLLIFGFFGSFVTLPIAALLAAISIKSGGPRDRWLSTRTLIVVGVSAAVMVIMYFYFAV